MVDTATIRSSSGRSDLISVALGVAQQRLVCGSQASAMGVHNNSCGVGLAQLAAELGTGCAWLGAGAREAAIAGTGCVFRFGTLLVCGLSRGTRHVEDGTLSEAYDEMGSV